MNYHKPETGFNEFITNQRPDLMNYHKPETGFNELSQTKGRI